MVRALNWVMRQQATGGDENEEEEEEEEEGSEEESYDSPNEEQLPGPRRSERPPGHMPRPGQPFLNTHLHNQCA